MSNTTVHQNQPITIGAPLDELPPAKNRKATSKWDAIAAEAKKHPNRWIPIHLGTDYKGLSTVVGQIKRSHYVALRDGTYDAAQRDGVLYVRYITDADVTPITKGRKKKEVA